jgi:signal transduction histidine kinase
MSKFYPPNSLSALPAMSNHDGDKLGQVFETSISLMQEARKLSIQEIMRMAVNRAVEASQSQIGYFHFVDMEKETVDLITWSTNTLKYCAVPDKETHYPFEEAGVWIDCICQKRPVIHNDYPALTHRKGLPEGHVAVTRLVSLPVIENDKVVAIIGVGNKKSDYDEFDVYQLSLLAESVWSIVQRKRSESALAEAIRLLELQKEDTIKSLLDVNTSLKKEIARQQSMESVLRKYSQHLKDLQTWSKTAFWQYDPVTQKITWSSMVYHLFEINHPQTSEILLTEKPLFFTEGEYLYFHKKLRESISQQQTIQYDFEIQLPDENSRHLMCVMRPIVDDEQQILQIQGLFQDFTEWLQEEKIRYALELERERRDILSDFLTQASHEFRTPLSVIKTNAYLISRVAQEKSVDYVASIDKQVDRLGKLINDLIEMAKLDRTSEVSFESLSITPLIEEVLLSHKRVLSKRDLHFNTIYHPIPLSVKGAKQFLFQALWQVLDNAIRYTPDGGTITIRTSYNGTEVVIEIEDTGMGIEKTHLPHIFERFFRVDKAHTTSGFGLGLSITKAVMDLHTTRVEINSVLNEGTICRLYIPLCELQRH